MPFSVSARKYATMHIASNEASLKIFSCAFLGILKKYFRGRENCLIVCNSFSHSKKILLSSSLMFSLFKTNPNTLQKQSHSHGKRCKDAYGIKYRQNKRYHDSLCYFLWTFLVWSAADLKSICICKPFET